MKWLKIDIDFGGEISKYNKYYYVVLSFVKTSYILDLNIQF